MTFPRALIIAVMTSLMVHGDFSAEANLAAFFIGGALWLFTNDPLPAAIKRGLEDFAKDYRR